MLETDARLLLSLSPARRLWPDTLATEEPLRDLDYEADVTLPRIVASVLNAHSSRRLGNKAAFRSIDTCESGRINPHMLTKYVSKYLIRGREKFGYTVRRQDMVTDIVAEALAQMDVDQEYTRSGSSIPGLTSRSLPEVAAAGGRCCRRSLLPEVTAAGGRRPAPCSFLATRPLLLAVAALTSPLL